MSTASPSRDYDDKCGACRHYWHQNEAIGDCRVFYKDVHWDSVHECAEFSRRPSA